MRPFTVVIDDSVVVVKVVLSELGTGAEVDSIAAADSFLSAS